MNDIKLQLCAQEMLAASENITQTRNLVNPELKHLGQAPVRATRNRTTALSPPAQAQSQAVLSSNGSPLEQAKDETSSNAPATMHLYDQKLTNTSFAEAKLLGQAPVRAPAITLFTEQQARQKTELEAAQSARSSDARDAEYTASMHMMLQQLDELSKSKQRITEEFRSSQQLTAQALRRLDEECERRQQLEHRVVDAEAIRDFLSRAVDDKTAELELVCSKLKMTEARAARLEQQIALSPNKMNTEASNKHSVQDVPALLTQPSEDKFQVRSFFRVFRFAYSTDA